LRNSLKRGPFVFSPGDVDAILYPTLYPSQIDDPR